MGAVILFILSLFINSNNSFKGELENYLKKNLSAYKNYKYEILQLPDSYKKIELLKPNEFNLSGNMVYVPIQVVDKSGRTFRSILSVRLKLYKNVLVASRQISRKENLNEKDFVLKEEDVSRIKGAPIYSMDGISSLRSTTAIKAGEVVLKQMLEQIPAVRIGDELNAQYIYGSVVVTTKVFARQEGVVGEVITVITSDNKLFKAKVIDSKNVIIIE